MIKVGDIIIIHGYDYGQMKCVDRKFHVLRIFNGFVLCQHIRAKYKECFSWFELSENGYVPEFPDRKDKERAIFTMKKR